MQTVLITGAAGFIGSHVADCALARGLRVVGIDNFDAFYDASLKRRNLGEVQRNASPGAFDFVEADICDNAAMRAAFERFKPTSVIHLAAKAGVRPSIADPTGYAKTNVEGTSCLLELASASGVERFVMASSSSVYGNNKIVPFSEEHDVSEPISPYAATKRCCELIASCHHHLTSLPIACLRFFTVYGPRQRPDLAIGKFMRLIAEGSPIAMFGDGSTSRDYTYIDDIVDGVMSAHDRIDRFGYRVWNLGGHHPVRLDEMIATIARVVGREAIIERAPMQPGDVERTYADLTRSAAELDFAPTTTFEDGVRKQWAWASAPKVEIVSGVSARQSTGR